MSMSQMYDREIFFHTYLKKSTEKAIFIEKFADRFKVEPGKPISILDLGCHDGALSGRLIDAVRGKIPSGSRFVGVDPSAASIDKFRSSAHPSFSELKTSFHAETAEAYFGSAKGGETFDWVIASHCLYWSSDLARMLQSIASIGRQAVIVLRENVGIYEIQSTFKHLLGNSEEKLYTADDIERALAREGIRYQRESIRSEILIPAFDDPGFKFVVSFFLQTVSERLSEQDYESVREYLAEKGNPLPHQVSFFWIGGAK